MNPNRKKMRVLVTLMVVALSGLIVLQLYLLNSALELKEQAFKQNVSAALLAATLRLQAGETVSQAFKVEGSDSTVPKRIIQSEMIVSSKDRTVRRDTSVFERRFGDSASRRIEENAYSFHVGSPKRIRVQISDGFGQESDLIDTLKPAGDHSIPRRKGTGSYFYRITTDSEAVFAGVHNGSPGRILRSPVSDSARTVFIARVIDNLWVSEQKPIEKRFPPALLDSLLRRSMREAGIPLEFSYGVIARQRGASSLDTVALVNPPGAGTALLASEFNIPLSPWGSPGLEERLAVDFSGRNLFLLRQLWPALLSSLIFVTLILGTFIYTVRTIVRQQRLAGQMVDFVNTMTHEFKTPISTVALAAEAIQRPDVVGRKTKVLRYNRMIAEEASRMKKQVDRILQMAQLEEGDFELTLSDLDVNELVRSAAASFALQVETRGGRLDLDLRASPAQVRGDAVHLRNIIHSILDNANKYSPGIPEIAVTTGNEAGAIVVRVTDHGVGIPVEDQKRVFEKYYRVPQGNLHDVKGFGLGLSYVKLLVKAHQGNVGIESATGGGTVVTVQLPERS